MKKTLLLLFLLNVVLLSKGQDNWTLYPTNKQSDSSLKEKNNLSILNNSNDINSKTDQPIDSVKLSYLNKTGFLFIDKDERIDSLTRYLAKTGKIKGYSVQISVSQETEEIRNMRKLFVENFPTEFLYDEYTAPNIFLYGGRFYSKNDAISLKKKLEPIFYNTMVITKDFPLEFKKEK